MQGLHSVVLTISSRCMYGHQQCVAMHIIPLVTGWLECMSSIIASRRTFGMATFSSIHTHPERSWRSLQYDCTYGFRTLRRLSLFVRMQSRTSFSTAYLLVSDAIRYLLKIFDTRYSNFGTCGLGVRGVLALGE